MIALRKYQCINGSYFLVPFTFFQLSLGPEKGKPCQNEIDLGRDQEQPMTSLDIESMSLNAEQKEMRNLQNDEKQNKTKLIEILKEIIRPPFASWTPLCSKLPSLPSSEQPLPPH